MSLPNAFTTEGGLPIIDPFSAGHTGRRVEAAIGPMYQYTTQVASERTSPGPADGHMLYSGKPRKLRAPLFAFQVAMHHTMSMTQDARDRIEGAATEIARQRAESPSGLNVVTKVTVHRTDYNTPVVTRKEKEPIQFGIDDDPNKMPSAISKGHDSD